LDNILQEQRELAARAPVLQHVEKLQALAQGAR